MLNYTSLPFKIPGTCLRNGKYCWGPNRILSTIAFSKKRGLLLQWLLGIAWPNYLSFSLIRTFKKAVRLYCTSARLEWFALSEVQHFFPPALKSDISSSVWFGWLPPSVPPPLSFTPWELTLPTVNWVCEEWIPSRKGKWLSCNCCCSSLIWFPSIHEGGHRPLSLQSNLSEL